MFKRQTGYTEITNFWLFTINFRKCHRQSKCTLQLLCKNRLLFFRSWFSRSFILAAASKMRGSNSSPVSTFILQISLLITPHEKENLTHRRRGRFKQFYLGNHSELDTPLYELFFSQWLILSPPKMLTFPPATSCIFLRRPIYLVQGNWLSSKPANFYQNAWRHKC